MVLKMLHDNASCLRTISKILSIKAIKNIVSGHFCSKLQLKCGFTSKFAVGRLKKVMVIVSSCNQKNARSKFFLNFLRFEEYSIWRLKNTNLRLGFHSGL